MTKRKGRNSQSDSREEQLRRLNRNLVRIGIILVTAAVAYEFFAQPGFSLQRILFLVVAAILGLAVGRTIGKIVFISRD